MLRLFLFIIYMTFVTPLFSAIQFYHLGTEKGLTEPRIISITQDSVGFIWLAGEYSLTRFDGNQFKLYKNNGQSPLPWNKINTIFTDSEGILWVGSDQGFSHYNVLKDQFVIPASGFEGVYISDFAEGPNGNIWVSTNQGLAKFDKKTNQITWFTGTKSNFSLLKNVLPVANIKFICSQPDGKIWIIPFSNGLYQLDPENLEIQQFETIDGVNINQFNITDICFSNDFLFLSTESNGFFRFKPDEQQAKNYIMGYLSNAVYHIEVENDSVIWLGTGGGLYRLNHQTGNNTQFSNIAEDPLSLRSTTTKYVFADKENNLWITSGIRGIEYGLNNVMFNHFMFSEKVPYCLTRKEVVCIDFDKTGNLWMGYESGLLEKHSSVPFKKTSYLLRSKNNYGYGSAYCVLEDSKNQIWTGGWQTGLQKFNTGENQFKWATIKPDSIAQKIELANVVDIIEAPGNNLWVSTSGNGVIKYNPGNEEGKLFQYNKSNPLAGISDNYTSSLCIDRQNNLWIACAYGLSRIDLKSEQITSYFHDENDSVSLSGNAIQTVHCDKAGLVWVGTGNGLNVFIPELNNFKPIKTNLENSFFNISSIESVTPGEIWVGTKSGLFCLTYSLDKSVKELEYEIQYYYSSNGLISNTYFDRSSAVDSNGMIYFGGNEGVDFFKPEINSKRLYQQPKALITNVSVYGKPIFPQTNPESQEIPSFELGYDQKMISIRFSSINFTNPNQQKYRYKLEGFDKQWFFPQEEKVATYTNLQPGIYLFVVETIDKNGLWSEMRSSASFTIKPPFWLTIPFYIVVFVLIFAFIYFIFWAKSKVLINRQKQLEQIISERTNELLQKNRELEKSNQTKNKFFSIVSHDLRSPFSGVLGILELLNDPEYKLEEKTQKQMLNSAKVSANNTFELMENLLVWARSQMNKSDCSPGKNSLSELLNKNIELKRVAAQQKGITLIAGFPENLEAYFDSNMIDTVIRNILSNAVKFSEPAGKIVILAEAQKEEVIIQIADSGIGLNEEETGKLFEIDKKTRRGTGGEKGTGLGLIICKEFIEKNFGKIWVTPNNPKGTIVHFTIPVNK
ncbi:MAG TPA: two-component regulator propeller domain-containing protein [Draconibacterium sp.]|nr:two-component regulator propeller domain-containing protein [Draconibacterium sp.]